MIVTRQRSRLAWWLWLVAVLLAVPGLIVVYVARGAAGAPGVGVVIQVITGMAFTTVGAIVASRRPEHRVGWLLLAFGIAELAISFLIVGAYAMSVLEGGVPSLTAEFAAWAAQSLEPLAVGVLVLLVYVFPTGQVLGAGWRTGVLLALAGVTLWAVGGAVRPGRLEIIGIDNRFGLPGGDWVYWAGVLITVTALVGGALSLVVRWRRGTDEERLQVKWLASAAALLAAGSVLATFGGDPEAARPSAAAVVGVALSYIGLVAMPSAIGIAVLRYRLYGIDLIINRAFVYGAMTAILAGIYTASIRLFNALFVAFTGEESDAALVITTLLLATTFTPIRKYLEELAERHFKESPAEGSAPGAAEAGFLVPEELGAALVEHAEELHKHSERLRRLERLADRDPVEAKDSAPPELAKKPSHVL